MNREDVAMDVTVQNVELLRKEAQAAKLLLSDCDEIFSEEGISNIELRGYLSGKLSADEVIELLASQQEEQHPLIACLRENGQQIAEKAFAAQEQKYGKHPEQAEGVQGEREAFEAHESRERRLSPADQKFWFRRGAVADYDIKSIDDAWKAWKARAALAQPALQCKKCGGTGDADSGGIHPWGEAAMVPCDCAHTEGAQGEREEFATWWNHPAQWELRKSCAMGWGEKVWRAARSALAQPSPAPELERHLQQEVDILRIQRDAAQARVAELVAALERAANAMWNSEANMDNEAAAAEEAIGNAKSGTPVAQAGQAKKWTYASEQETNCAGCGVRKHTPLRVDWMGGYVCLTCIDEKLEELYEALPDAQAGQVPEWISCEDQMPPANENVLVSYEFTSNDWRIKVGGVDERGNWWVFGASWTPSHWQPLPTAPAQGE